MAKVTTLFWDVGGVILTNAWDRNARRRAAGQFQLDWEEFEDRHELVMPAFELGQMTLVEYLKRTVFYRARPFGQEDFKAFMFAQSSPHPETLDIVAGLARSGKYLLATLNNESAELNHYRIEQFRLRDIFTVFFSSCYLGARKPDEAMYRHVLRITQTSPEECIFVDDRALNLECACLLGMRTIHYLDPAQLRQELERNRVELDHA